MCFVLKSKKQKMEALTPIGDQLTADEADFVKHVFCNPGLKYPGGPTFWDKIDMDCGIWIKPESLGIVRSVGSYKWEPTGRLQICIAWTAK